MRAKCLKVEKVDDGAKDFEVSAGRFYKVLGTGIQSMSNEPFISLIGNSGNEIQRPQRNFQIYFRE